MVKFFGIPFRVHAVHPELSSLNMGETQFDKCRITLMGDLPVERQRQVFMHESMHNLLDGEDVDERFVRRFSNTLYEFLDANHLLRDGWYEDILDAQDHQR